MSDKPSYGVQAAPFSQEIHAGELNKNRDAFTDKHDVTPQVFRAIAEYVIRHHDGSAEISFGNIRMEIDVQETYTNE